MFLHVFPALPTDVAAQVIDIVDNTSEDSSYDTLKRAVFIRLSDSRERVQQLLSQVEPGDHSPSQLLRHMRSLMDETKYSPANMMTCLATNINRNSLDELAHSADKIQELFDWSCVHAVGTLTAGHVTTQQSDILTKLLEEMKLFMPNISSQSGNAQRPRFPKHSDSSAKHRSQMCYSHRIKMLTSPCQPGPASDKRPFFNLHTPLYAIWTPINQDMNMAESLDPNYRQPSKTSISVAEFELLEFANDSNSVQEDIHGFLSEHTTASHKTRRAKREDKLTKIVPIGHPTQESQILWRITKSQHYLIHASPLLALKSYIFTRKGRLRGSFLQKRSFSTYQPLHKLHRRLLNFKPPAINCIAQAYQKNQASEPPPATVAYLLLVNPNSVLPNPPIVVFSDNEHPPNTPARPFSKDTVQPFIPSAQFSPQDTVSLTIANFFHISTQNVSQSWRPKSYLDLPTDRICAITSYRAFSFYLFSI
ncbi:unnamed protein product [Hymenolepis diminuta]|uniref:Uncharacterized protein n=1 Tax=Hymenolepis diminuta TaxID=6216 RepID=A0A564YJU1_HYMDI|nr:unnamed protein product [Hymenolepis diminuta]